MSSAAPITVLLVEDNPDDVDLVQETLADATIAQFELRHVDHLEAAHHQLSIRTFDAVLLDLGLPDSSGLRTLERVLSWRVDVPVVVLTGLTDEVIGTQAVQLGAEDYLVKGLVGMETLARNLHFAVERHRLQQARDQAPGGLLGWLRRLFSIGS
ncbi:MAG: hypothetical protein CL878_14670 [Dehalococcoidia bacterium]|nr:hypothetical protein [Dehalococcoidia bacterium]